MKFFKNKRVCGKQIRRLSYWKVLLQERDQPVRKSCTYHISKLYMIHIRLWGNHVHIIIYIILMYASQTSSENKPKYGWQLHRDFETIQNQQVYPEGQCIKPRLGDLGPTKNRYKTGVQILQNLNLGFTRGPSGETSWFWIVLKPPMKALFGLLVQWICIYIHIYIYMYTHTCIHI